MKRLTTEEFILRAREVHGDKYDYSKSTYTTKKEKVIIICPIHGEFEQSPDGHLRGQGCPKCKTDKLSKERSKSTEQFVADAKNLHGDFYDYSKVDYKNSTTNITIICPIHGEFQLLPLNHLKKRGCPECGRIRIAESNKLSEEEYLNKIKAIHKMQNYNYSITKFTGMNNNIEYICPIHGKVKLLAYNHLYHESGCPLCKGSNGELLLRNYLTHHKIDFIEQYAIDIDKAINISGKAYIDFYLPKFNTFIEYNGELHYRPMRFNNSLENFQQQIKRDNFVKEYCKMNNINFIEIPYNAVNVAEYLADIIPAKKGSITRYIGVNPPDIEQIFSESCDRILWEDVSGEKCVIIPIEYFYTLLKCYKEHGN